jgi:hypothetical protein
MKGPKYTKAAARKSERGWEEERTVSLLSRRVSSPSEAERRFQTLRLVSYITDRIEYNPDGVKTPTFSVPAIIGDAERSRG